MILAFISQKGGSGKTTLSVNIAAFVAANGFSVSIVDLDPQASASAWCEARDADDISIETTHPPLLDKTVNRLRKNGANLILIDTPPHNSTAAANAVSVADFVIVPVRPASFDLAAVADTARLVKQAVGRASSVINAIPPNTKVADPASEILTEQGLPILSMIGQRMAFQHAATLGKGVVETEPSSRAAEEVIELWNAINRQVNA